LWQSIICAISIQIEERGGFLPSLFCVAVNIFTVKNHPHFHPLALPVNGEYIEFLSITEMQNFCCQVSFLMFEVLIQTEYAPDRNARKWPWLQCELTYKS